MRTGRSAGNVRNELARITFIRALINGADKNVISSDAQLTRLDRESKRHCENSSYYNTQVDILGTIDNFKLFGNGKFTQTK